MDLFPQDLGVQQQRRAVLRRILPPPTPLPPTLLDAPPRLGRLGRIWSRGSGLSEERAAISAPAAANPTVGAGIALTSFGFCLTTGLCAALASDAHSPGVSLACLGIWLAANAGIIGASFGPMARKGFRRLHRALQTSEVDALLTEAADPLERSFLELVRDAVRQSLPAGSAHELRQTIVALAEALDRLPDLAPSTADPASLRAEAAALDTQSHAETDSVTGDSLHRRADALRRRADAVERSSLTVKRTAALKAELQAQIEALREGIAALQTDRSWASGNELAHLSEAVRQVATEAISTIDARAELAALSPPLPTEPNIQRLGR